MKTRSLVCAALALAGCHDFAKELQECLDAGTCLPNGNTVPSDPSLEWTDGQPTVDGLADFSNQWAVGDTSTPRTFSISNKGRATSGAVAVALGGANPGQFELQNDRCTGQPLAYQATCTFDIVLHPTQSGSLQADLNVGAMPGNLVHTTLKATAASPAELAFTPTLYDFQMVEAGKTKQTPLTLSNGGGVPANGVTLSFVQDAGAFALSVPCPSTIGPASNCMPVVVFQPPAEGSYAAQLFATANDGGLATSVTLLGQGTTPPAAQLSTMTTSIDFMRVSVGQTGAAQQVVITNVGGQPTSLLMSGIGGLQAGAFSLSADTCTGATLQPMAQCYVQVSFTPSSAGDFNATLSVSGSPNGGSVAVMLHGTGDTAASLSLNPSPWDFGPTAPATSKTQDFALTNNGTVQATGLAVSLSDVDGGQFVITSATCGVTLAGSGAPPCTITVKYTAPPNAGSTLIAGSATLNAIAMGTQASVSLSGESSPTTFISFNPASFDFGRFVNGNTGPTQSFTVTNVGSANIGPLTVTMTGVAQSNFSTNSGNCNQVLNAGNSCSFPVTFKPNAGTLGPIQATVTVSGAGTNAAALDVRGTSITEADLAMAAQTYDAGEADAGSFVPVLLTLINYGENPSGPVGFYTLTQDAGANRVFVIDGGMGSCLGSTVPGDGGTCQQQLLFYPEGFGSKLGVVFAYAHDGGFPGFQADGGPGPGLKLFSDGRLQTLPDGGMGQGLGSKAYAEITGLGHGMLGVTLNVGAGGSVVTADGGTFDPRDGGTCAAGCTFPAEGGVPLTLGVGPARPGFFFSGWSGACTGNASTCVLPMSVAPGQVTAGFGHYNFAFVTSAGFKGAETESLLDCDAIAHDAGLPGNYRKLATSPMTYLDGGVAVPVFLSDGGVDVFDMDHYVSNNFPPKGWVRTDGKPFVQELFPYSSLTVPSFYFPVQCDEHGRCADPRGSDGGEVIWSGETLNTQQGDDFYADPAAKLDCTGWTVSTTGHVGSVGSVFGVGYRTVEAMSDGVDQVVGCSQRRRVVCVELDLQLDVTGLKQAIPDGGRVAFLSQGTLNGGADAGTANALCQQEAATAGLPSAGTFVALRSSPSQSATSLLNLDGGDWYRVDGYRVISTAAMSSPKAVLEAPLVLNASGATRLSRTTSRQVWTGGAFDGVGPTKTSGMGATCNNWSTSSSASTGVVGSAEMITEQFWDDQATGISCNRSLPVYCFQN